MCLRQAGKHVAASSVYDFSSYMTTETYDLKPAGDLWMQTANRGLNERENHLPCSIALSL